MTLKILSFAIIVIKPKLQKSTIKNYINKSKKRIYIFIQI